MLGIVEVAEYDGACWTGLCTGSLIRLLRLPCVRRSDRLVFGQLVTVKTEAAFFNNPPDARRNIRAQVFFHPIRPDRIVPVKYRAWYGQAAMQYRQPKQRV
jgi:hypothetical protein